MERGVAHRARRREGRQRRLADELAHGAAEVHQQRVLPPNHVLLAARKRPRNLLAMLPRKTRSVGSRVEPDDGDDAPRDARGEADHSRRRLDAVPEGARADAGHRAEDRRRRRGRSADGGFSDRFSPYPRIRRNRGIRRNRSLHRSLHRLHRSLRVADVSAGARRNKNPFLRFLRFVVFAPERSPAPPSPRETLRVHARVQVSPQPQLHGDGLPRGPRGVRGVQPRQRRQQAPRRRAVRGAARRAFASDVFFQTPVLGGFLRRERRRRAAVHRARDDHGALGDARAVRDRSFLDGVHEQRRGAPVGSGSPPERRPRDAETSRGTPQSSRAPTRRATTKRSRSRSGSRRRRRAGCRPRRSTRRRRRPTFGRDRRGLAGTPGRRGNTRGPAPLP